MSDTVLALLVGGVILNLFISSGALWKMMDFAKEWGATQQIIQDTRRQVSEHAERILELEKRH